MYSLLEGHQFHGENWQGSEIEKAEMEEGGYNLILKNLKYNWQNCKIFEIYNRIWCMCTLWKDSPTELINTIHHLTYLSLPFENESL